LICCRERWRLDVSVDSLALVIFGIWDVSGFLNMWMGAAVHMRACNWQMKGRMLKIKLCYRGCISCQL
jgi:hypothetical protein